MQINKTAAKKAAIQTISNIAAFLAGFGGMLFLIWVLVEHPTIGFIILAISIVIFMFTVYYSDFNDKN